MIRLLLLILLIFILWQFINRYKSRKKITKNAVMVSCDHCGVYFPKEEAFYLDRHYYCCKAHYEESRSKDS